MTWKKIAIFSGLNFKLCGMKLCVSFVLFSKLKKYIFDKFLEVKYFLNFKFIF